MVYMPMTVQHKRSCHVIPLKMSHEVCGPDYSPMISTLRTKKQNKKILNHSAPSSEFKVKDVVAQSDTYLARKRAFELYVSVLSMGDNSPERPSSFKCTTHTVGTPGGLMSGSDDHGAQLNSGSQ